jgi:hypothetical protein
VAAFLASAANFTQFPRHHSYVPVPVSIRLRIFYFFDSIHPTPAPEVSRFHPKRHFDSRAEIFLHGLDLMMFD